VRERRDSREQLLSHVFPHDEQLHRLEPPGEARLDEVLALADEEPQLLALAP
jgi:hypothetical protein